MAWRVVACAAASLLQRLRCGGETVAHSRWSSLSSAAHCVLCVRQKHGVGAIVNLAGECGTVALRGSAPERFSSTAHGSLVVAVPAYLLGFLVRRSSLLTNWDSWFAIRAYLLTGIPGHFVVAITPGVIGWSLVPQ